MSEKKLNADAPEWKPNVEAKPFTPSLSAGPKNHNSQQRGGMNHQRQHQQHLPQSFVPNYMPYAAPFNPPYYPDPNFYYANMYQPQYGNMMQPPFPQATDFNHNNRKKNNSHHNNNTNGGNSTTEASKSEKKESNKMNETEKAPDNDNNASNDEPVITFGDLGNESSTDSKLDDVTEQKESNVSVAGGHVESVNATNEDANLEEKKDTEKKIVPSASATSIRTFSPRIEKEEQKHDSDWKRNVAMVEKTCAQMLLRKDGIVRYGKSQLCSMNAWNKTCPPEIKVMYQAFAAMERAPMSETPRQLSPSNRQNNSNKNQRGGKNQQNLDPHPDEQKIFSSEHLNSDTRFGGGRPDKVVDTTSNETIISQANFILNVMTIETFDKMSDKFMKVGLDSEELMKVGVDLIVSKAQLEEHFSFMYADLCKKITDQWVTPQGEEGVLGNQFRQLLLKRCQEEFEQDRDAAVQAVLDLKLPKDEEDEKLLILKKRYTGHMRFVGEIYMKDMLKASTIHKCINELLTCTDDNEKLACLCKLFQTIGKKLEDYETRKKRTRVQEYFDRIAELVSDKSLSSKVRFGFKDLIEMRENNWTARRVEEKAKKLSEIRKLNAPVSTQSSPRGSQSSTPRSVGTNSKQDVRGSTNTSQDVRNSNVPANEWTTVSTSTKGKKGAKPSGLSSTPTSAFSGSNNNSFSALNVNNKGRDKGKGSRNSPMSTSNSASKKGGKLTGQDLKVEVTSDRPTSSPSPPSLLPGHDGDVDATTVNRIIAATNEYYSNDMIDELVEVLRELVHENGMWKGVHATMHSVMSLSAANREKYNTLLPKLYSHKVLSREQAVKGISYFLDEFDDFVIDVPLLAGYFSEILAHLYVNDVFDGDVRFITTLPNENMFSTSYRMMAVVVQSAVEVKKLSSEEKAVEFFKSALDVTTIDKYQKEQLVEAVEKHNAGFLPYEA